MIWEEGDKIHVERVQASILNKANSSQLELTKTRRQLIICIVMNIILDWGGGGGRVTRTINFKLIMDSKFAKIKKKQQKLPTYCMFRFVNNAKP